MNAPDPEACLEGVTNDALLAIDGLMKCWAGWNIHDAFYLDTLCPQIVANGVPANARPNEAEAVSNLRAVLDERQWHALPALLRARRHQLARLQGDREKAARRAEAERELAARMRERAKSELGELVGRQLRDDFLGVDGWLRGQPLAVHLPALWLQEHKVTFVQSWARDTLGEELDPEQALAVATLGNVRVTARAGSGKTRTLVTRAAFLVRHCRIPAHAVLLVAFNRAAAEEMTERLRGMLPDGAPLPFSMTFHALAHALVHPEEDLLGDSEQRPVLSSLVQTLINRMLSTRDSARLLRAAMLEYFSTEWETLDKRGVGEGREAYFRRQLEAPLETFSGDFVKSYGEKLIANTLFLNDIGYRYERAFRWNEMVYRPDFTILHEGKPVAVVEYFGRAGDEDYDEQSAAKRIFWSRRPETLLELSPADIALGSEHCARWLLCRMDELDVPHRALSEDEVWGRAQRRAVDRFSKSVTGFIGRARQQDLSPVALAEQIKHHIPRDTAEAAFLELAGSLYGDYIDELAREHVGDFAGLMWRAVRQLADGQTLFTRDRGRQSGDVAALRYVHVDEFQDFSAMFSALLRQLVQASRSEVFAVGDDWQAINGFAGADLDHFESFPQSFPNASLLHISTNYRSPVGVVAVGNEIMRDLGVPARAASGQAGAIFVADPSSDRATERSTTRFSGDASTPALLRLLHREIVCGVRDIAVLLRRKSPWRVQDSDARRVPDTLGALQAYLLEQFPDIDDLTLRVSTAHAFKGREADTVIIADAQERAYPLLHPAWSFTRVFGDDEQKLLDEEQRLFYVASTRARRTLIYLISGSPSRFLTTEQMQPLLTVLQLDDCPPVPTTRGGLVEIRVTNAFDAKARLKELGFRWNPAMRVWHKRVSRGDADIVRVRLEALLPPGASIVLLDPNLENSEHSANGAPAHGW